MIIKGAALGTLIVLTLSTAWNYAPAVVSGGPCQADVEGSWSIGLFKGDSPLKLTPVERLQPRVDGPAAWPVANPVLTCASVTEPASSFVADPFLWQQSGGNWYLFFETKTSWNRQGDIGVAESSDGGASWRYLGLALDEPFHLSYPFVFEYNGQIYMLPESSASGTLRLYRAVELPLKWELDRVLVDRPLIDTSLVEWEGRWWMFTSDKFRPGAVHNAELEIYYADTPLGPWQPHELNPIMNGDKRAGARMAGRVVPFEGKLLRFGQDNGATYGHEVVAYRIDKLTPSDFQQTRVPFEFGQSRQGSGAWNGMRAHHVDVQQAGNGTWVAVMDGDFQLGSMSNWAPMLAKLLVVAWGLVLFASYRKSGHGLPLLRAGKGLKPAKPGSTGARPGGVLHEAGRAVQARWHVVCRRVRVDPASKLGWAATAGAVLLGIYVVLSIIGTAYSVPFFLSFIWDKPNAAAALAVGGQMSKFTLVVLTHAPRMINLKLYVKHYSKCPSVDEILIIWNNGPPPDVERDLPGSLVPIRLRVEKENSLLNRFKPDPLIRTRAVLEMDDDILVRCVDIERGFAAWRENPHRMVGYFPRLAHLKPSISYLSGGRTMRKHMHNLILTGAAFMDQEHNFPLFWDKKNTAGRAVVEKRFNCEDILMNFLLAKEAKKAGSNRSQVIEYVDHIHIDTFLFSKVAISSDLIKHYGVREECIADYMQIFHGCPLRKVRLPDETWDHYATRKVLHYNWDETFRLARAIDWAAGLWPAATAPAGGEAQKE